MDALTVRSSRPSLAGNIAALAITLRPRQWTKNLLVFSAPLFSGSLLEGTALWRSLAGFVVFCAASSGIYLINDLLDIERDREHPLKKSRPIASGRLDINTARVASIVLLTIAVAGALQLGSAFMGVVGIYITTCLAYSVRLKHYVLIDVMAVAFCFLLRALSGAVLVDVQPSEWLILCTSLAALMIGLAKRRHELTLLGERAHDHRRNLSEYSVDLLTSLINISAGAAVITYALYARAPETVTRVGSRGMLLTLPFVVYGIFRYLFLIYERHAGGDPAQILFSDRATRINLVSWVATAAAIVYLPKLWTP